MHISVAFQNLFGNVYKFFSECQLISATWKMPGLTHVSKRAAQGVLLPRVFDYCQQCHHKQVRNPQSLTLWFSS